MSTKIYNGFRFTQTRLDEIMDLINSWRADMISAAESLSGQVLAIEMTNHIDRLDYFGQLEGEESEATIERPFMVARSSLMDRILEVKKTGRRNPIVDFDISVSIFPHNGRFYGMLFTEQRAWEKAWMSQDCIESYGYWNNSDPEDGVSDEDWEVRGKVWESILGGPAQWRPTMAGLDATIFIGEDVVYADLLKETLGAIPSLEKRARRLAKEELTTEEIELRTKDMDEEERKALPASFFMSAMLSLNNEEGEKRIAERGALIAGKLRPEITKADALNDYARYSVDEPQPQKT